MPKPRSAPGVRSGHSGDADHPPVRVVLADDSEDYRALLAMKLGRRSDVTLLAGVPDGESALQAVSDLTPDVVLLDVSMPRLDGFTVARRVRALAPRTRIVMLTGHPADLVADDAKAAGADAVVQKGGPIAELLAALRDAPSDTPTVG